MKTSIRKFVYENPYSIPPELCRDIIHLYEEEGDRRYQGVTSSGLNIDLKRTLDYCIPNQIDESSKWYKVQQFLSKELSRNLKTYVSKLQENPAYSACKFEIFGSTKYLTEETFMIQRYTKQEGIFKYHNDFNINWEKEKYRVITYLWYLNDVDEGGQTEIFGDYHIKPETGKLLLFPASWDFPHRGIMPISNDKYIITGWLYSNI